MLISSSTSRITSTELSNNKHQRTDADNSQNFNTVLAAASTRVNISDAAQQQAQENVIKSGGFGIRNTISSMSDETLSSFLKEMVYEDISGKEDTAGGLLDISDWINGGPLRYSNTGEPVTPESKAYFNTIAERYKSQKISIFETEMNKETSLIEIYEKLADLTSQQNTRFLGMMGYLIKPS
ncbi:hypothetical protein GCM10010096_11760 [Alcaligenes pakistanensis]|uniref:Uncharacterized protein n=1 Tax=Alcaligenes pakistanensis TaxID=1482717 RepID=A0A8H9IGE9_9BURK|nr:hypothetical protein [Alcaligenes pakistanensis]GHC42577.1 hypothetical protein GCM10010096_11760 [Alcaligenes pakistanensis]